jgi:hypothetical protein
MLAELVADTAIVAVGLAVFGAIAFGVWDIRRQLSTRERTP